MQDSPVQCEDVILALNKAKFLKILKIELEHLQAHTDLLIDSFVERDRTHQVTEHVYHENLAVLRNEEYGFNHFARIVDQTDPAQFDSLEALADHLRKAFDTAVRTSGLARAAYCLTDRQIDKIIRYVNWSS